MCQRSNVKHTGQSECRPMAGGGCLPVHMHGEPSAAAGCASYRAVPAFFLLLDDRQAERRICAGTSLSREMRHAA